MNKLEQLIAKYGERHRRIISVAYTWITNKIKNDPVYAQINIDKFFQELMSHAK